MSPKQRSLAWRYGSEVSTTQILGTMLDEVLEEHEHPGTVAPVKMPRRGLYEGLAGEDELESEWAWESDVE